MYQTLFFIAIILYVCIPCQVTANFLFSRDQDGHQIFIDLTCMTSHFPMQDILSQATALSPTSHNMSGGVT